MKIFRDEDEARAWLARAKSDGAGGDVILSALFHRADCERRRKGCLPRIRCCGPCPYEETIVRRDLQVADMMGGLRRNPNACM